MAIRSLDDDGNPITTEAYLDAINVTSVSTPTTFTLTPTDTSTTVNATSTSVTVADDKNVLYIGNSLTVGMAGGSGDVISWGVEANNGFLGFTGRSVSYFVSSQLSVLDSAMALEHYDAVVINFGTNSLGAGITVDGYYSSLNNSFVAIFDKIGGRADIYVGTVPPLDYNGKTTADADTCSEAIRRIASENGVTVIENSGYFGSDITSNPSIWAGDNLHLNTTGYAGWLNWLSGEVGGSGTTEGTASNTNSSSSSSSSGSTSTTDIASIGGNRGDMLDEFITIVESQAHEIDPTTGAFLPTTGTMNTTWDWGLGSVIDYTFGQKYMYTEYSFNEFTFHVHAIEKSDLWGDALDFLGDPFGYTASSFDNHCLGTGSVVLPSHATASELEELVKLEAVSMLEAEGLSEDTHSVKIYGLAQGVFSSYTPEATANKFQWLSDISSQNSGTSKTAMRIQAEDYVIASRSFNHSSLSSYRSVSDSTYPIYIPLIKSAATMSGTVIYDYYDKTTREELSLGVGDTESPTTEMLLNSAGENFATFDWITCGGYTATATRSGGVFSELPYPVERAYPWGLEYLRDYATLYQAIIPEDVMGGTDFAARLSNSLESRWTQSSGEFENSYLSLVALGILIEDEIYQEEYANIYGQQNINEIKLYSADSFDMTEAMGMVQKNTVTNKPWLQEIVNRLENSFTADIIDWVAGLLSSAGEFVQDFARNEILGIVDPRPLLYTGNVNADDMLDLIISTISFSQATDFLQVEAQSPENLEDMFIFVGKRSAILAGTSAHEFYTPPGLSTIFEDAMSPTTGAYQIASSFGTGGSTSVTIKAPANTSIFAVGYGVVSASSGGNVTISHRLGGESYIITYENLTSQRDGGIVIDYGTTVTLGTQIGMIADNGNDFTLTVMHEGVYVDPMTLFYQDSESGYGFITGYVPESSLDDTFDALESGLGLANNYISNNRDRWHTTQGFNSYADWTQGWWAWGRGAQFLEWLGYPVATILDNFGTQSNYIKSTQGVFQQGLSPQSNSWVVFEPSDPSGVTQLGYVEAVISGDQKIQSIIVSYVEDGAISDADLKKVKVKLIDVNDNGFIYWGSTAEWEPAKFIYLDEYLGTLVGYSQSVLSGNYNNDVFMSGGSGSGGSSGFTINADGWTLPLDPTQVSSAYTYGISSYPAFRIHPITGLSHNHSGVDIALGAGNGVYAAASGTVTVARYDSSYGNYVEIRHDNGFITRYAHMLAGLPVSAGQRVDAGQKIGEVGSTGSSTGNHLHWELRDSIGANTYASHELWIQLYEEYFASI